MGPTINKKRKPRLELALYSRAKHPNAHHYALLISPKYTGPKTPEPVTKHHAKNTLQNVFDDISQPWRYERVAVDDVQSEPRLLARVVIGKLLVGADEIEMVMEGIRIWQDDRDVDVDGRTLGKFDCTVWVKIAVDELSEKKLVKGLVKWEAMKGVADDYVGMKKSIGRWDVGWKGDKRVPMMDLMTGEELVG